MPDKENAQLGSYESKDGKYSWILTEKANGVLATVPKGVATREGADALFDLLSEISAKRGGKLRLMSLSRGLENMESDAKDSAKKLLKTGTPIDRFATVGDNFFMRAFFKLYSIVADIEIAAFQTEEEATAWLQR
jgi:hypothetical protein